MISISDLERHIDLPVDNWHGNCFALATAAADVLGRGFHAVYGHYLGPVSKTGFWGSRSGDQFVQHGWVITPDGGIIDPTRWSFEDKPPYIFMSGSHGHEYDEGGNKWRSMFRRPPPRRVKGKSEKSLHVSEECLCKIVCMLGPAEVVVNGRELILTVEQIFWLANAVYDDLAPFNGEVYTAIEKLGMSGFVPIDNFMRAQR